MPLKKIDIGTKKTWEVDNKPWNSSLKSEPNTKLQPYYNSHSNPKPNLNPETNPDNDVCSGSKREFRGYQNSLPCKRTAKTESGIRELPSLKIAVRRNIKSYMLFAV